MSNFCAVESHHTPFLITTCLTSLRKYPRKGVSTTHVENSIGAYVTIYLQIVSIQNLSNKAEGIGAICSAACKEGFLLDSKKRAPTDDLVTFTFSFANLTLALIRFVSSSHSESYLDYNIVSTRCRPNSVNAAKVFYLFVKKRVIPIHGKISGALNNYIRIRKDSRMSVYQSPELCNF
jgi:hypothetical protein